MSQLDVQAHPPTGELADCSSSKTAPKAVSYGSLREYVLISPAPGDEKLFHFHFS